MACTLLEEPSRAVRIDGVSESHHRYRHAREPPLSTVVRSMMPVAVGSRPGAACGGPMDRGLAGLVGGALRHPGREPNGRSRFPGTALQITRSALPIRCYLIIIEENVG